MKLAEIIQSSSTLKLLMKNKKLVIIAIVAAVFIALAYLAVNRPAEEK